MLSELQRMDLPAVGGWLLQGLLHRVSAEIRGHPLPNVGRGFGFTAAPRSPSVVACWWKVKVPFVTSLFLSADGFGLHWWRLGLPLAPGALGTIHGTGD